MVAPTKMPQNYSPTKPISFTTNFKIMIELLKKWSKPVVIVPFLLLYLFFSFFLFPKYGNQISGIAGEEVKILDYYPKYTKAQVTELFTKIKAEGRDIHRFITGRIDMVYPLIYGPLLMLLIAFFMLKLSPKGAGLSAAFLVPLLLMLTDYAENFTTLQLLSSFPNLDDATVARGSFLANLKLVLLLIAGGMVIFSALFWILQSLITMTLNRKR